MFIEFKELRPESYSPLHSVPFPTPRRRGPEPPGEHQRGIRHVYIEYLNSSLSAAASPLHFLCLVMQTSRTLCHCTGDSPCESQAAPKAGTGGNGTY